jgi:Na+/H+-dicarboxylate symporter
MEIMSLTKKIIIGMVLGLIVGFIFNLVLSDIFDEVNKYLFIPLGQIFLKLIKMLVVPIVLISLILGTAGISDPKKLGRMGVKTVAFFLVTTAIAITIALGAALIFKPGTTDTPTNNDIYEPQETPPIMDTLLNIIPTNAVDAMVQENMLQLIVFAIFIGFALARLGNKVEGIYKLVEQANDIMMYLVTAVMKFAPYGAFGLLATAIGNLGFEAIKAMGSYMIIVLSVLLIQLLVVYGLALTTLGKMNPLKFYKGFSPAMIVAFSTSSSSATLPVSMRAAQENLGVSKPVSGFVQPLGATINMDGTAIMQGVATVFIAQVVGADLTIGQLLTVLLTATLASIGTAGVPGVGLIMLSMVLTSVGLPVEAIALILGVDRILDMCRTATNITGDAVCAVIVERTEGESAPPKPTIVNA